MSVQGITTPKTIEDWLLFLTPIVGALAGFNWGGFIPGTSGFVVGVLVASLAKTLIGLGQNPHLSNWEDMISFALTFFGLLATAFSANPQFVIYGLIFGLLVKSLGFLSLGLTIEDIVLAIGALIAGYGEIAGIPVLVNLGLLLAIIGKAIPSIGTGGTPVALKLVASSPS